MPTQPYPIQKCDIRPCPRDNRDDRDNRPCRLSRLSQLSPAHSWKLIFKREKKALICFFPLVTIVTTVTTGFRLPAVLGVPAGSLPVAFASFVRTFPVPNGFSWINSHHFRQPVSPQTIAPQAVASAAQHPFGELFPTPQPVPLPCACFHPATLGAGIRCPWLLGAIFPHRPGPTSVELPCSLAV